MAYVGLPFEVVRLQQEHSEETKQFIVNLFPTTVRGFHVGVAKHLIISTEFGGKGLKRNAPGVHPLLGISSVIDVRGYFAIRTEIRQITTLVELRCRKSTKDEETRKKVSKIVNEAKLGLIINERKENSFIPRTNYWMLLRPLQQQLQEFKEKDPKYQFEYFLMTCKLRKPMNVEDAQLVYTNPEEEVFAKHAEYKFEFRIVDKVELGIGGHWKFEPDKNFKEYRSFLLIKASKLDEILDDVKQTL